MRISSRGTVSMGPLGWAVCAPFILAAMIVWAVLQLIGLGMAALWRLGRLMLS